jgi:uncharacterized membrane protein
MKNYALILIVFGLMGLVASAQLMIDTVKLAENPDVVLPCNLSPFVSCTSINSSSQSRVFGFPNPILGLISFAVVITIGVALLTKSELSKKFMTLFIVGLTGAIIFIHWLIFESIYVLGNLCLYCMVTWTVIWPIFLYSIRNYFSTNSLLGRNHLALLIAWYLLIVLLIFIRFREYFIS